LKKETEPYQIKKGTLPWGLLAAGTKATAGNALIIGMGMTVGT